MHSKYLWQSKTRKTAHQNALEQEAFLARQEASTAAIATQEKQQPVKARDQLGEHAAELKSYLTKNGFDNFKGHSFVKNAKGPLIQPSIIRELRLSRHAPRPGTKDHEHQRSQLTESINAVSINTNRDSVGTVDFQEEWTKRAQIPESLVFEINQKLSIIQQKKSPRVNNRLKERSPKRLEPGAVARFQALISRNRNSSMDGATEDSAPEATKRQQNQDRLREHQEEHQYERITRKQKRQDRKKEHQYMRRKVDYGNPDQININVDIPDSPDYYNLQVNIGKAKTPGTSVYVTKYYTDNGQVGSKLVFSHIYTGPNLNSIPNKFSFWMNLIFRTNIIQQAITTYPFESLLTLDTNLAGWTWRNDKHILLSIWKPDDGIRANWKDFDTTAPVNKEENTYFSIQQSAYNNAKSTYSQVYASARAKGDGKEAAMETALHAAEVEYFKTIIQSDIDSSVFTELRTDYNRENEYMHNDKHELKRDDHWNCEQYRTYYKFNTRRTRKWRNRRITWLNNTLGKASIGLTRQIRTGRVVYKICNQKVTPQLQIAEIELAMKEKVFVHNAFNNANRKAYNYEYNHRLFATWKWKDLLILDPYYDVRLALEWSCDQVIRVAEYTMNSFGCSKRAERIVLISLIAFKIGLLAVYNSGTPKYIKRIFKKTDRIYKQCRALDHSWHEGQKIHHREDHANTFLGNHERLNVILEYLHRREAMKHYLYQHPKRAEQWTTYRNNHHGIRPQHVEYEVWRDFKGKIAIAVTKMGYELAIIASFCLCFYDLGCVIDPKTRSKVIRPKEPYIWWHNHNPFHDFMQDIRVAICNLGGVLLFAGTAKSVINGYRSLNAGLKQIHDNHTLFPSPSQWMMIYFRNKFRTDQEFRTKVANFIKNDTHLTELPTHWERFIFNTGVKYEIVKDQVERHTNEGETDSFKEQANEDIVTQSTENPSSEGWSNALILDHDLIYYSNHKFRVKHHLTHQFTLYALRHATQVEKAPFALTKYIFKSLIHTGSAHAYMWDSMIINLLKQNISAIESTGRVERMTSAVRGMSHISNWEHSNHIDLNYLFNPNPKPDNQGKLTEGFDYYFLKGDTNASKTKVNQKINLNVNIDFALINGFQSHTVQNYYDQNGAIRTVLAILKADEAFRQDLRALNTAIKDSIDGLEELQNSGLLRGQKYIIKRCQSQFPDGFSKTCSETRKLYKTDRTLMEILEPRQLLADIVLSLIVKKVFTAPLNESDLANFTYENNGTTHHFVGDLNKLVTFCKPENKAERQLFYHNLTHPLQASRRHCRLFYETALYWDVLVLPSTRQQITTQYQADKSSHQFTKFWSASKDRSKNHKSLYGLYSNLSSGQIVLNDSLYGYLQLNYDKPSSKSHRHGYYHYHPHPYVYNNRASIVWVYTIARRKWQKNPSWHGMYTLRMSLFSGKLKPVRDYLAHKFGINIADKLPLTNRQKKTLNRLSKLTHRSKAQLLKDIDHDDLTNEQELTFALAGLSAQYSDDLASLKTSASLLGIKPQDLYKKIAKAGTSVDTFVANIQHEEQMTAESLRQDLHEWSEKLTNEDRDIKTFLGSLQQQLTPNALSSRIAEQTAALGQFLTSSMRDAWGSLVRVGNVFDRGDT